MRDAPTAPPKRYREYIYSINLSIYPEAVMCTGVAGFAWPLKTCEKMGLAAVQALSAPDPKELKAHFDRLRYASDTPDAPAEGEYTDFSFWRTSHPAPAPQPAPPPQPPAPPSPESGPRICMLGASVELVHLDVPPLRVRLERFEAGWKAAHGGRLPTAAEMPLEVADLYAQFFKNNPRVAAAAAVSRASRTEADADERAVREARAAARAAEWAEFEAGKKDAWTAARAGAWEQRAEAVGGSAAAAAALSGAASFLREEAPSGPAEMTSERYVEKMRDQLGLTNPDEHPDERNPEAEWATQRLAGGARSGRDGAAEFAAEESAEWAARGGAAADAAARAEAWAAAEATQREAGGASGSASDAPAAVAAAAAAAPVVAAAAAVAPGAHGGGAPAVGAGGGGGGALRGEPEEEQEFSDFSFWRRPAPAPLAA